VDEIFKYKLIQDVGEGGTTPGFFLSKIIFFQDRTDSALEIDQGNLKIEISGPGIDGGNTMILPHPCRF